MLKIFLFLFLIFIVSKCNNITVKGDKTILLGIDTVKELTEETLTCLIKGEGLDFAIFRLAKYGKNDEIGAKNVKTVTSRRLSVYVYIDPNPYADGAAQLNGALEFAKQKAIYLSEVFLLVTNPYLWDRCHSCNVRFINSVVEAGKKRGIIVKLFTNWYDYGQITGNSMEIPNTEIWYWNVNAIGLDGRTEPNFLDSFAFGPFSEEQLVFKQYIRQYEACDIEINRTIRLVDNPLL